MKILKGVAIFLLSIILFGSCFEPPDLPATPSIEFQSIEFKEVGGFSDPDSLILYINFKDGDGDLGLSSEDISDPFHEITFFLEKGDGVLEEVSTAMRYTNLPPFINATGQTGKLATIRTRKKPGYESLPAYVAPFTCTSYIFDSVYVSQEHKAIFDDTYNIYDTLRSTQFPDVYVLLDTFYYQINPTHYNIEVDFLTKNNDGTFTEFDWRGQFCTTYDGRFPILAEKPRALEGTLRYGMTSTGFLSLFSTKTLKLRIKIRDRSLKESNIAETGEFTLNQIRK